MIAGVFAALAACGPLPRGAGSAPPVPPDSAGVPVLAWHAFTEQPGPGGGNLTEPYARFEEMLAFLQANGFRSVFPDEVRPGADRRRMVVLTFDDGTTGQLRAAEMLERHGFRGIFFVIPERAGRGDPRFLDSAGVARLARGGHRVAPHGWAHCSMATSPGEVEASLRRSPAEIARQSSQPQADADFAFPFGHYTPPVARALVGTYRWLHTVDPGYWDGASPLLPRLLVMNDVDLALYQEYVLGGARHRTLLQPLDPSGAVGDSTAFLARGPVPPDVELLAVSADARGRSYASHPLGDNLRLRGDTAWVDLAGHMRRYFPPGRIALSYALVVRRGGRLRYLTPGLLHWLRDPAASPGATSAPRGCAPLPGARANAAPG
jgi:peptidoglycan/xylan/chitin deacetylase (PgdA/CDA1 family)